MELLHLIFDWASDPSNSTVVRTFVALLAIPGALWGLYLFIRWLGGRGLDAQMRQLEEKVALVYTRLSEAHPADPAAAWAAIQHSAQPLHFQSYLRTFHSGLYADLARTRYNDLVDAEWKKAKTPEDIEHLLQAYADSVRAIAEQAYRQNVARYRADGRIPVQVGAQGSDTERWLKPFENFRDAAWAPEMVLLPPGSFKMGSIQLEKGRSPSEGPQHEVRVSRYFAVGKRAVTNAEWAAWLQSTKRKDVPAGKPESIAERVTWFEAEEYASWLSSVTGKIYRLLSEAEWEYAARAGTSTKFWWGDEQTAKETYFGPNVWGLHVHNGHWEWVEDHWSGTYASAPADGSPVIYKPRPGSGLEQRVLRGGREIMDEMRVAARNKDSPRNGFVLFAVRMAREV